MKLGKTSWLVLIIGFFIIAFGSLGVARAQQVDQQSQLTDELAVSENRLSNLQLRDLQNKKQDLEQQLDQAQYQLGIAQDALRQPIDSIPVTEALFEIADASGVIITAVSSSGIGKESLQKINCSATKLSITALGTVFDLITFITKLNTDFTTSVVQSAEINPHNLTAEETEATDNGTEETTTEDQIAEASLPTANIQMVIYSY